MSQEEGEMGAKVGRTSQEIKAPKSEDPSSMLSLFLPSLTLSLSAQGSDFAKGRLTVPIHRRSVLQHQHHMELSLFSDRVPSAEWH